MRLIDWTTRASAVLFLITTAPTTPAAERARSAPAAPVSAQDQARKKCCFTNPGYSGTCEVEPAKDESCGQILGYLNNPMAQGKSYCGNTQVRSGWKQTDCAKK
jgi:hypothetical protein